MLRATTRPSLAREGLIEAHDLMDAKGRFATDG
jgi:hypothetical protein